MLSRVMGDGSIDYSNPRLDLKPIIDFAKLVDVVVDSSFPFLAIFDTSEPPNISELWK